MSYDLVILANNIPSPMSANKYGLTASNLLVPPKPLRCSCLHVFTFLWAVMGALCVMFGRDNRRVASLHVKDFMAGVKSVQFL